MTPRPFLSPNTFQLSDSSVTYTVQFDSANLPTAIVATFAVRPSRDFINVNENIYVISYNTVSTGSLFGQGKGSIAIANSSFTLGNPFDSTKAKFIFADANIFDAASVIGQFSVDLSPTFFIGGTTYTLDPVNLVVTDNDKRPYPLIANPMMFSINGFNYVIDTNRVPHAIVGNDNVSPLATDMTVQRGLPVPNTTFTLNGQIYAYTEDLSRNLLTVTGTKSYMIAEPALTFALDSSLVFTLSTTPPTAGNYPGTTVPIGTIKAGSTTLNLYAGTPESGNADFFMYKNVLYTLVKSGSTYLAVQKSYTVYASTPAAIQQQLAVFDLAGATYMVTEGTTPGVGPAAGINPGTMWAQTATSSIVSQETQFGLVYGFAQQPTNVSRSAKGVFQFQITDSSNYTTLYDILYTPGSNTNAVTVDVPALLPTFMETGAFTFLPPSCPLTFETGGYNAFTTYVTETSTPSESFSGAYKTPVISFDPQVDSLITPQGDFSLEFWHSIPLTGLSAYHPFTYSASTAVPPLVYYLDVDFEDESDIYVRINETVMHAVTAPPVFTSGWRHFALTYAQPYVMLCLDAGFEVKQASNYNFDRNFSIAMTFSAHDVSSPQGLLYKGTGGPVPAPELSMSYRVGISGGVVTFDFVDGASNPWSFTGPSISADTYYELIIVKSTDTAASDPNSSDPFKSPIDPSEMTNAMSNGANFGLGNFPPPANSIEHGLECRFRQPQLRSAERRHQSQESHVHLEAELLRHHIGPPRSQRRHSAVVGVADRAEPEQSGEWQQWRARGELHRVRASAHWHGLRRQRIPDAGERVPRDAKRPQRLPLRHRDQPRRHHDRGRRRRHCRRLFAGSRQGRDPGQLERAIRSERCRQQPLRPDGGCRLHEGAGRLSRSSPTPRVRGDDTLRQRIPDPAYDPDGPDR